MQESPERIDTDAARDSMCPSAINTAWPHQDVGDSKILAIFGDDLLLLYLAKGIRLAPELRMCLDRTRFIKRPSHEFLAIGVDRERADEDESPQMSIL